MTGDAGVAGEVCAAAAGAAKQPVPPLRFSSPSGMGSSGWDDNPWRGTVIRSEWQFLAGCC